MALQDMTPADLAAVMNNDGEGFGNNGWWIILLFMFLGWGNRGYGGNGAGSAGGDILYPWLNSAETVMNGFANVTNAITGGFANAETAATARQMADMQQNFNLSQQLSQCCCDNRMATANLATTISDGIRDMLAAQNASTQRVLDKLCDQEITAERRENDNLRQQINMMNLAASQNAQTAQLLADNAAQTNMLEQYLAPIPRPAYVVQNPNCCQNSFGFCNVA